MFAGGRPPDSQFKGKGRGDEARGRKGWRGERRVGEERTAPSSPPLSIRREVIVGLSRVLAVEEGVLERGRWEGEGVGERGGRGIEEVYNHKNTAIR